MYGWLGLIRYDPNLGSLSKPGQIFSFGVPRSLYIMSSVCCSCFPGNKGSCFSSSARMHPTAQLSTAAVYRAHPNNSSGARYHSVTTLGVYDPSFPGW